MPKANCKICEVTFSWIGNPDLSVSICPICATSLGPQRTTMFPMIRIFELGLPISRNAGKFERYLSNDGALTMGRRCESCRKPAAEVLPPHAAFPKATCRCEERLHQRPSYDVR